MLHKTFFFLFIIILCACQKHTNSPQIENLPHTKHLLDSALQVLEKITFTKDTSFNEEDMYRRKPIEVSIQSIAANKSSLGLIAIQETDTSYFHVFIFEVKQPHWRLLGSIDDFGFNQLLPEVSLVDVDFDNKKDLLLTSHCLSSRIVSRIDCFGFDIEDFAINRQKIRALYSSGKYCREFVFDRDTVTKTITCYTDGGVMGTDEARVYRWHQDTLQLFRQLDMVYDDTIFIYHKDDFTQRGIILNSNEELKEGDTIGYQIFLNEYALENGVMKLKKQTQDFQEGAMFYFENWK
jgi:hypothetical protein